MDNKLRITILVIGIVFAISVFFLLVTRRINERASLPWIAGTFIIMIFSLLPSSLVVIAHILGVVYPPTLLFLLAILIILILLLYQSIQISILQNKCQELAQNLAIISSIRDIDLHPNNFKTRETIETYEATSLSGSVNFPL